MPRRQVTFCPWQSQHYCGRTSAPIGRIHRCRLDRHHPCPYDRHTYEGAADMNCMELLRDASQRNLSLLCVGLDPDPRRIPAALHAEADPLYAFCMAIVEAIAD